MRNKYIKLDFINENRNVLFGIASLLIIYFHMYNLDIYELINIGLVSEILYFLKKIGNYGVDIFLFLSGIGLYFSMSKNNMKTFYKNRFMRIIPVFIGAIFLLKIFIKDLNIVNTMFGISFFVNGIKDFWYIYLIIILYLIFPLIYKIIKKYDIYGLCGLLLVAMLFNFIYSYLFLTSYLYLEIAFTRIPVFLIGTFFGKIIYENRKIRSSWLIVSIIVQLLISIIIYLNVDIPFFRLMVRYLYCLLAITTVINISWLCSLIKNKNSFVLKVFSFFGWISLELYLVQENIYYLLEDVNVFKSYVLLYFVGFILSICMAYILKKIVIFLIYVSKKIYEWLICKFKRKISCNTL